MNFLEIIGVAILITIAYFLVMGFVCANVYLITRAIIAAIKDARD